MTTVSDMERDLLKDSRHAAAKMAAVHRASSDAIISCDLHGGITGWNGGAEHLLGYAPREILGRPFTVLTAGDGEAPPFPTPTPDAGVTTTSALMVCRGGAEMPVRMSVSAVVDELDGVIGSVCVARPTTLVPVPAPELYQSLLQGVPDATICFDTKGCIRLANGLAESLFGYSTSELVGRSVEELLPAAIRMVRPILDRYEASGRVAGPAGGAIGDLLARRQDGSDFTADISFGSVVVDGHLVVMAAVRDVTDHVLVQAELIESEARFRQLADNVEVGFVLRSMEPPGYLYVSPGYQKIFGYNPMDVSETPLETLSRIHPDDRERVRSDYWGRAAGGSPARQDFRIIRRDGKVRWVRGTVAPVVDSGGVVRRAAATVEDITDQKVAEDELRAAYAAAESANAAKTEYLGRVSHELRTPMNAVIGFAQLLEFDPLTKDQHDAVRYILRGGRHLLSLIDDVLDIANAESNRLEMSLEAVNICDLITETTQLMAAVSDAADVAVTFEPGSGAGRYVTGDNRRLRQVVLNLLSNAIKYNRPAGWVNVRCEITRETVLDVVVQDSGLGIRAQDLPRLFTPFDRLGAANTGIEGTGIGLALAERLMTSMGGTLRASSRVGVGSTFTASIPLAIAAFVPAPGERELAGIASDPAPTFAPADRTMVYIEDNNANVRLLESLIGHRSRWKLMVAGHGALGLELAAANVPDLVLLDLHLPDMNGIDVLRRLRADPPTSDVKIVVMSADANPHQIERLLGAGADDYLTKPVDISQILSLLDE